MRGARGIRVIAGTARGRRLRVPAHGVRPTKDVVREAVFSALQARQMLAGASVLDLYAGTGACAIEGLSRGAAHAVLVEKDRRAAAVIDENLELVGFGDRARVLREDAARFAAGGRPREAPFDVVFVDPPYDAPDDAVAGVIEHLRTNGLLADGAVVVVERPVDTPAVEVEGFAVTWERVFGDTLVVFLTVT